MAEAEGVRSGRRFFWGLLLIALGALMLADRLVDAHLIRHWWPVVFFAIGAGHVFWPRHPRQIASGVYFFFLGFWFFACQEGWWGFSYQNAWPLLVVGVGLKLIVGALVERRLKSES